MIRPDDIIAAVGGKVFAGTDHAYYQPGRIEDRTQPIFTRGTPAWVRYGRARWAESCPSHPRWGRRASELNGEAREELVLILEDEVTQIVAETNNISTGSTAWTFVNAEATTGVALPSPFDGFPDVNPITKVTGDIVNGFYQTIVSTGLTALQMIGRNYNHTLDDEGSFGLVDQGGSGPSYRLRVNFRSGEVTRIATANVGWRESGSEYLGDGWWRYWMSADISAYTGTPRLEVRLERTSTNTAGSGFYPAYVGAEVGAFVHSALPSTSSTGATKAAESIRIPGIVGAGAGALTYYQESIAIDAPGDGSKPQLVGTGEYFGVVTGWTDGPQTFVGGAVYQRGGRLVFVGSTSPTVRPRDLKEEVASISTDGFLTYEISVNRGPIYRVRSTDAILPVFQRGQAKLDLESDQETVVAILARGSHSLEAFRGVYP